MVMITKGWTLEEAQAATELVLREDPKRSSTDPTLPLFQWAALHRLDDCREQYKQDGYWLMTAIRICANHELPLPEWAAIAYIEAYDKVNNSRAKSWNTVFGNPYPKGTHLNAARRRRELKFAVWNEISQRLAKEPETPIDEALFEEVGRKFDIKKTLTSEYYYAAKKCMDAGKSVKE